MSETEDTNKRQLVLDRARKLFSQIISSYDDRGTFCKRLNRFV